RLFVLPFLLASPMFIPAAPAPVSAAPPATRIDSVADILHGVKIADPYRWLEDDTAPEVAAWTAAQNAHTRRVLDPLAGRAALQARFWSLHEIGSIGAPAARPVRRGRTQTWRYFYTRREGKQNQAVLFVREGLTGGNPRTGGDRPLVDVNALSAEGTRALDWWFPSEDGRLVAYGVSADGSEESVLRVRDADSGRDLPEAIPRTRACSVAWLPDGGGFYYTRYPTVGSVPAGEEPYHRHVFFHRLGSAAGGEDDVPVFGAGRDLKDWPSVALSPDGRFLGIEVSQGWSRTELFVLDRRAGGGGPRDLIARPVAAGEDAIFDLAEITNDALFVRTNAGAPRYRLVRVPLPAGSLGAALPRSSWRDVLPEQAHPLQQVSLVGDTLAALYLADAASRVRLFDLDGRSPRDVPLPTLGTVGGLHGHRQGTELFMPFTSFLSPTAVLRQSLPAGRRAGAGRDAAPPAVWQQIPSPLAATDFVISRDKFKSKDGTEIPLFLVHRRDRDPAVPGPTLLYGYGGFNVDITPGWSPSVVPFLEKGGVYALAVLRGGGEYGETWHRAGMLAQKQNVFDDFIGAAEHLIAGKVTAPDRLAIMGRSNGGLLVGAAMTQRPDLFRAVVCGVPLLDMLRYHRFRIAKLWIPEYGSADDAGAFQWLRGYSPYHNVRDGVAYPAVLFTTAASDTRVDPLHARKMTARLQAANPAGRPVLLRLETQAGHGAGKPLGKVVAQLVDEWSFLFAQLTVPP
ncbi:MAG: prolyl oligopeptidase family serine peptidase, partial [Pseudomonadota bacterium]